MSDMDLSGQWRAIDGDAGTSDFHNAGFDDSAWHSIDVPSHWVSHGELASGGGTVFYRKTFEAQRSGNQRAWLCFEGVFSHANVWVDGSYAGELDGYFAPHSFEVTNALSARREHAIAAEVTAPSFDIPWASPGGIWRPVSIRNTGSIHMSRVRVLCSEAREERGVLTCYAELDAADACEAHIRTVVATTDHEHTRKLAAGPNRISWQVNVDQPELWWPWSLGNQAFYNASIQVTDVSAPGEISDSTTVRTAFRTTSFDAGYTYVNGERIFLQAIESGNDGTPPIHTDHEYFDTMLHLRRDAGANLVVRTQWIEPQAFYDVADELGMLVWQGVPFSGDRPPQPRHARQTIEVLGHHPSVALWLRPQKRLRDRRPAPDSLKRILDRIDPTRANIEQPLGWDLNHLGMRDVMAIVPKWTKRSHLLAFTSDPREAANHVEALRLLKYRPLGGFIAPLALPELLHGASEPIRVIIVAKDDLAAGRETEFSVHMVNDTREPLFGTVVIATVGDQEWRWGGDIGRDSTSFVGVMSATPGTKGIDITLRFEGRASGEHSVHIPVTNS